MRFSVSADGKGYRLTVTDGEEVILSVATKTLTEAHALQRQAVLEGVDTITVPQKASKGKADA